MNTFLSIPRASIQKQAFPPAPSNFLLQTGSTTESGFLCPVSYFWWVFCSRGVFGNSGPARFSHRNDPTGVMHLVVFIKLSKNTKLGMFFRSHAFFPI